MSIDIKTQQNTLFKNSLLRLSPWKGCLFEEDRYHFLISVINENKTKFHFTLF